MRRTARPWPVSFTVEGLNIERFVRRSAESGIRMTGMRRRSPRKLTALVQEDALPVLQQLATQGGWRLKIGNRRGVGRIAEWIRKRWLLSAAGLCAVVALLAASRVMWSIDVVDAGTYEADIRAALQEQGITVPMLRRQVDIGQLREALEWRYPRVAWFECGWRGTSLVIRPTLGVLPRIDTASGERMDVVATRDGIVHSIVTAAGTPVVRAGEIVREGQVLIRGEERTSDGAVKPVQARGSVIARVWRSAAVQMSAREQKTDYTGRKQTVWTIRTPWFDLWQMPEADYALYDASVSEAKIGGIFLPARLHVETRMEAEITSTLRDIEALKADAAAASQRKLREMIGPEESLIDIWENCSMIDAENLLSVATCELHQEIGKQVPASGMAAPAEALSE